MPFTLPATLSAHSAEDLPLQCLLTFERAINASAAAPILAIVRYENITAPPYKLDVYLLLPEAVFVFTLV